jgi:hypothetical protein
MDRTARGDAVRQRGDVGRLRRLWRSEGGRPDRQGQTESCASQRPLLCLVRLADPRDESIDVIEQAAHHTVRVHRGRTSGDSALVQE